MRGDDQRNSHLFSYLSPEQRVPGDHPLRSIRTMTDEALRRLSSRFDAIYATTGRPSIPTEHLLRGLLLQVLYSVPCAAMPVRASSEDGRNRHGSRSRTTRPHLAQAVRWLGIQG